MISTIIVTSVIGCSTQKNTSSSRWWHSFNARYNTYYNGSVAYIDGSLEKENGNKDNFTELIPLYTVGNKASRDLGKSNFTKAIEKSQKAIKLHSIKKRPEWNTNKRKTENDKEWLNRKEYNPFLWKAWLLMGRSQFHSGAFEEAASTFSYMSRLYETQPSIYGRARAWLAKSYIEEGWLYDAEDVIRNMQRDSIHWQAQKEWDYTYADYYIHTKEYDKAIPYLQKVIKHEMRRKQKAREWLLMGQLHEALGHKDLAYKAYQHVIRQSPPYEIEFNARIAMTEVMAHQQARKMIGKLTRMAKSDKNKDYLDQVYYAIGNIYLTQKDTTRAIYAYEDGNKKATRSGIEKGVLLLKLGDLYWDREKYNDAQRCYGEAIGLLDKDRKDFDQLANRSKLLDELVPFTDAVHLQDSLQVLAKLPEAERNAAIDRVIDALKKKEKLEAGLKADQNAMNGMSNTGPNTDGLKPKTPLPQNNMQTNSNQNLWYFYNQMAVNQGKTTFQRLWGKRENIDNWQRVNKTVVAMGGANNGSNVPADSAMQANMAGNSGQQAADSARNDQHKREYYLAQIPFKPEQIAESNRQIMDGLFQSGIIFKDKLDNLPRSEKALRRLTDMYTDFEKMDEAFYHLFLLYSRKNQPTLANDYIQKLKSHYPNSQWTALLSDPHFEENARFGKHIEDSLYAATYNAFKADRYHEVRTNYSLSTSRFPLGENRDKFIFIDGLSKLNSGDSDGCLVNMNTLIARYAESSLSQMAGMIINGVKAGKRLRGGKFDIGNVWTHRAVVLSGTDTTAVRKFSNERNADFNFIIAYHPDSVNENKLLFNLAKYNFTSYPVRNFNITIEEDNAGLHRMQVTGFLNFDEALQYARSFHRQANLSTLLGKARTIVISNANLDLLGNQWSYDDYDKFYSKHFAPLKISTFQLLTEPVDIEAEPSKPSVEQIDRLLDDGTFIDNGLQSEPVDNGTILIPQQDLQQPENQGTTVIQEAKSNQVTVPNIKPGTPPALPAQSLPKVELPSPSTPTQNPSGTMVPTEKPVQKQPIIENGTTVIPVSPDVVKPQQPAVGQDGTIIALPQQQPMPAKDKADTEKQQPKNIPQQPVKNNSTQQQQQSKTGETIIYFGKGTDVKNAKNDAKTTKTTTQDTKKKKLPEPKVIDFGDEYYDLEGF